MSSTFNDFQAERHVLQTFVFPVMAERLRGRRHDFEPIDLRLGVETAAEADQVRKTLLVLRVCLREVARSRPFLIVMVGDCYGWVPPAERAQQAAVESGLEGNVAGRSITHLEVDLGVMRRIGPEAIRTFAYFRRLDIDSVPPQLRGRYRDVELGRVSALKDQLREALGDDRCRTYDATWDAAKGTVGGLEEFRRMVQEDVWRDLDDETRPFLVVADNAVERERSVLEAFVHDTARDFTGREELLAELSAVAVSNAGQIGTCVVGPPGSGKSSVAAELIRGLRDDPSLLLLAHAAGIEGESVRIDRILRRWCGELAATLDGSEPPPGDDATGEELEHAFAGLLTRTAADRHVVIVLDALDELERSPRARRLTWLPRLWPANAVLIATTTPGPEADALRNRVGFRTVTLEPLTGGDASRMLEAVYRRYRRRVNPDVKHILLGKRAPDGAIAAGNPLWLELAGEEMNLLDPDELARATGFAGAPDVRLVLMQSELAGQLPPTAQGIYSRMLRRAGDVAAEVAREEGVSPDEAAARDWSRCLSELIAVSRSGWRESDLRSLLDRLTPVSWSELMFASVRRAYRGHLIERGSSGLWNFYHRELRRGVLAHFASSKAELEQLHAAAAAHLATLPQDNPLRRTERMHHLIGSNDRSGAALLYAESAHGSDELRAQTESLADLVRTRADGIDWIAGLLNEESLDLPQRVQLAERITYPLHDAFAFDGRVKEQRALLIRVRDSMARLAVTTPPESGRDLASRQHAVTLLRLADLAFDGGDFATAEELYDAYANATRQGWLGGSYGGLERCIAFERLGTLAERRGAMAEARAAYENQLEMARTVAADVPADVEGLRAVAAALEHLGGLALADGDAAAATWLGEAAEVHEGIAALTGQAAATGSLAARALLAEANGKPAEARELLQRHEAALHGHALAAPENVEAQIAWISSLHQLGDATLHDGDPAAARQTFQTAVERAAELAVRMPDDVNVRRTWSLALEKFGDAALLTRDFAAARPSYEQSLQIREGLRGRLPDDVQARRDLGLAYERLGALEDQPAERRVDYLRRALALYTQAYEELPGNETTGRTLAIGELALAQALARIPGRQMESHDHAGRAHKLLSDLRAGGRRIEAEADRVLAFLDTQFGGSGRWTHPVPADSEAAYVELNMFGMTGAHAAADGDFPAAELDFRRSLALARQIDHPPSIVRACGSLGNVRAQQGDVAGAVALLNEAIAVAREHHLAVEEGQTLSILAELHVTAGNRDAAQRVYEERIALADRAGDHRGWAMGTASLGLLHFERRQYAMAIDRLTAAERVLRANRMLPELARAWSYLGVAYQALGDAQGAMTAYRQHVEVSRDIGDAAGAAGSMANLSGILYAIGQQDEAIMYGEEALRYLTGPEADPLRARVSKWKRST